MFLCENWLSLLQDDGLIERVLPVSSNEALTSFKTRLSQQTHINVTEHHLWLSLFLRPRRSRFTRVQRLSCLLALLFLSMITNAMYYKSAEEENNNFVQIGVFRFSPSSVFVSMISIIITTIPVLFLTIVFRNIRLKNESTDVDVKYQPSEWKSHERESFAIPEKYIKERRRPLPFWVVYFAWSTLVIIVLTSAFFLLLYSMEWGSSKSEEWILAFVLSFFESIVIVDPLKVRTFINLHYYCSIGCNPRLICC